MFKIKKILLLTSPIILVACVNLPTGPSVMVLPGSSKSFEQFRYDDYQCRHYAYEQVGGVTTKEASTTSGAESAAVGTGIGAAAGAALGGGEGAAIGAGTGLLAGGLAGASASRSSAYASQYRYDIGYIQCMYAKGHRVPVSGKFTTDSSTPTNTRSKPAKVLSPPPGFTPPPPPPGNPPPPPSK